MLCARPRRPFSFFFTAPATPEIYTLSLHDALPISRQPRVGFQLPLGHARPDAQPAVARSEEHTSELQSLRHLVCRLPLEKKKRATHAAHAIQTGAQWQSSANTDCLPRPHIRVLGMC